MAPTAAIQFIATSPADFNFQYDDGEDHAHLQSVHASFTGNGIIGALLSLSPKPFNFGSQPYNFPSPQDFTLTNAASTTAPETRASPAKC